MGVWGLELLGFRIRVLGLSSGLGLGVLDLGWVLCFRAWGLGLGLKVLD